MTPPGKCRQVRQFLSAIIVGFLIRPAFSQVSVSPEWITLQGTWGSYRIQPDTLAVEGFIQDENLFECPGDRVAYSSIPITGGGDFGPAEDLTSVNGDSARWALPRMGWSVLADVEESLLEIRVRADGSGAITWPVMDSLDRTTAWVLPLAEGHFVPVNDLEWIAHLTDLSPLDTTEGLSMPMWGRLHGKIAITYILTNPFDNLVSFERIDRLGGPQLGMTVTHEFRPNWQEHEFGLVVALSPNSPLAPALIYRQWLIDRGEFVSMSEKIESTPRAERLLGAAHIYLWGNQILAREDIARGDWPEFCRRLTQTEEGTVGHRIFSLLSAEARQTVLDLPSAEWPDNYMKGVIVFGISRILAEEEISPEDFHAEFSDLLGDPETWGDGYSTKMIDAFAEAGLDRLWLGLGGWEGTEERPNVADHADERGHLLGTYDSYHSIHRPDAHPDQTWTTAQFDWDLWETGGVMGADGTYHTGFKGRGRHLSPLVAMPHVEERVSGILDTVAFNSWFIDCDAYGEFFDDYHPDHTATKRDDMEARLDRLAWIRDTHDLVIGSEGGSAYAAPMIHFAHGMMTPVIGWGDPRNSDRESPYYRGGYYPPDGPRNFVMQVPLAPEYVKFHCDPRFRLPLYQAAFHDSVIATHHWGTHSLKFTGQVVTNTLLEMLYQVPPLYHMNLREFPKHRDRMVAHSGFFSPLHRETALMPLTDFEWLSEDRLVQRTVFGERIALVANFSEREFDHGGATLPPRSVLVEHLDTGAVSIFTPTPP
jgi:hypothetical protein